MKSTTVYLLRDPRDNAIRYVGKTTRPLEKRLSAHICRTNLTPKRHSSRWISGLVSIGLKPIIEAIETLEDGSDWQERERFWISHYRDQGAKLTNITDGGEGVAGYVFPAERKQYMSDKFKDRVFDDEWKAKISAAKRGKAPKPLSPEAQAKRIAAAKAAQLKNAAARTHCRRGHELTEENTLHRRGHRVCRSCKNASDLKGYHATKAPAKTREEWLAALAVAMSNPETRARLSAAGKKRFENPEAREKHAAARRGKPSKLRGDKFPLAKLDWQKVADIRRRNGAGEPRAALAKEYGVCPAVVDRIIWNQTWKTEHMPTEIAA